MKVRFAGFAKTKPQTRSFTGTKHFVFFTEKGLIFLNE